ncbi:hypothetical protein [Clostridium beijerinckii]|uniref:hypothetical protein n=1 Tax=Clostridium beijerinckii TaxID=1520 RepID=UPI00047E3667|nr:hypothetical protein [Clostridium beijerinckii]
MFKKDSLNNIIVNIVISVLCIIFVCMIIGSVIIWKKTSDLIYIISGVIGTLGILFNIYLLSKEKSRKNK